MKEILLFVVVLRVNRFHIGKYYEMESFGQNFPLSSLELEFSFHVSVSLYCRLKLYMMITYLYQIYRRLMTGKNHNNS